jgi:hypothetical protein
VVIILKSYFVRREHIYFVDQSDQIKKISSSNVKMEKPLKKCSRVEKPMVEAKLTEISGHLGFFSDFLVSNTATLISHGKVLSIYDFKTT